MIQTSYLEHIFTPDVFPKTVDTSLKAAEKLRKETGFDTIAFSGISGAAIAFILSHWMDVPLLCVRKKGENSHFHNAGGRILEGNVEGVRNYIIADDFIASGATCYHIIDSIRDGNSRARCVGMLMYRAYENSTFRHQRLSYDIPIICTRPQGT
jgi:adenine/guanine phosphoribosyltransferase-like PRPP-binding protein